MHAPERPARTARNCAAALLAMLLTALLAGCSSWGFPGVYRINVEQGNIVTREMLDQLQVGMNRRQVRYILGTPLVEDPFNDDRWEYLYMVRNGERTLIDRRLTVFFEGDTLTHWDSNHPPPAEDDSPEGADDTEQAADADAEAEPAST